jgi:hypothetical protein
MMRTNTSFALLVLLSGAAARAQDRCPPLTVRVDNDVPGSGYSEERPENWESRNVNPCAQTYRYLSHTVGDGSRIGRAIWRPNIAADGWYAVEISYRATENRSDNVRYLLHDDLGGRREHFENQAHGGDCTRVDVGEIYCRAGGECRVVLDGNDGQSPAADETVFRRTRCDAGEPPPPGPCDGIRAQAAFEVCAETPTTCAGVFTNGAGCVAYCAAAGMTCRARFGGEPGCMQEPNAPLDCAADNGHASDWCECEAPPAPPHTPAAPAAATRRRRAADLAAPGRVRAPGRAAPGRRGGRPRRRAGRRLGRHGRARPGRRHRGRQRRSPRHTRRPRPAEPRDPHRGRCGRERRGVAEVRRAGLRRRRHHRASRRAVGGVARARRPAQGAKRRQIEKPRLPAMTKIASTTQRP